MLCSFDCIQHQIRTCWHSVNPTLAGVHKSMWEWLTSQCLLPYSRPNAPLVHPATSDCSVLLNTLLTKQDPSIIAGSNSATWLHTPCIHEIITLELVAGNRTGSLVPPFSAVQHQSTSYMSIRGHMIIRCLAMSQRRSPFTRR